MDNQQDNQNVPNDNDLEQTMPGMAPVEVEEKKSEAETPTESPLESSPQNSNAVWAGALAILLIVGAFVVFNNRDVVEVASNSKDNGSSSNSAAVLMAASNANIGDYLTDESGMTLYTKDGACTGVCLDNWPPYLYSGEGALGELGLIAREDTGGLQYTYNDNPLYYFVGDVNSGDVNGHGNNGWSVIRPN